MKLFIYEHITSGALINEPLPTSLAREGNDMLIAIVQDLAQLSNIELIILRDIRLEPLLNTINSTHIHCYTIDDKSSFQAHYRAALNDADMVLPIAPETDDILSNIQQQVIDNNKQLLGCQPNATKLTSDKYQCFQQLKSFGLESPNTIKANEWPEKKFNSPSGFIIKPFDGAGCINTLFLEDQNKLEAWLASHAPELNHFLIQPYLKGLSLSLSLLVDHNNSLVLAINQQHVSHENGKLSFHGCTVNGSKNPDFSLLHASNLANKVHQAISGLWGFIGIDLILHNNTPYIVDINPRLTTSYIGLRQSLNINPAKLLLMMMKQSVMTLPELTLRQPIEVRV